MDQTTIRKGYKKTDAGEIPEDWTEASLSDFVSTLEAGTSVNSVATSEYSSHAKSVLKTSCVSTGYFFANEAKPIAQRDLKRAKLNPRQGAIVISRMNTPNLVGEVGFVDKDYRNLFLPDRLWQTKYKAEAKFNSRWLAFALSSPSVAKRIKDLATGTSNSMKNISKDSLLAVPFPSPPHKEQTAIANTLSDTDSLITGLEKLINKKRAIKTAAMQQLLTGKTRLPGFDKHPSGKPKGMKQTELGEIPPDWEVFKIGEIAQIQRGASPRPIDSPVWFDSRSSIGWLRISDVTKTYKYLFETSQNLSEAGVANSRFVAKGNLVMSICATVGRPILLKKDICIHDGFVLFANLSQVGEYIFYVLCELEKQWSNQGQTGSQMNLNTELINSKTVPLPPEEEQIAIANVLSQMDRELEALAHRLNKTRQIKQGMMQELLTGRTRLV